MALSLLRDRNRRSAGSIRGLFGVILISTASSLGLTSCFNAPTPDHAPGIRGSSPSDELGLENEPSPPSGPAADALPEASIEQAAQQEIQTALSEVTAPSGDYALKTQDLSQLEAEGVNLSEEERAALQALLSTDSP